MCDFIKKVFIDVFSQKPQGGYSVYDMKQPPKGNWSIPPYTLIKPEKGNDPEDKGTKDNKEVEDGRKNRT